VRVPKLIGVTRMMDMMLTGRTYDAAEGQAIGFSHYLVASGKGLAKGIELAERIAENAPLTNFAVMHVLPRIAEGDAAGGYLAESLMAAIAQGSADAKARLKDFLEKRGKKVLRG
jgi:enoyl-CoA hydratase/carnithine racemase